MGQTSFRYFVITHFIVLILITPISQIPQYLTKISHNAPFCNRNVHKCVHSLQWRHNERDGVSNHQPHGCLLNCLVWRRSKNTPKLRVTAAFVQGTRRWPVNSPHRGPVTRKMFPFDGVLMFCYKVVHCVIWYWYFFWFVQPIFSLWWLQML